MTVKRIDATRTLLSEITGSVSNKERLSKAHCLISTSKSLLQKVTVYERVFKINPEDGTQDVTQIGNNQIKSTLIVDNV